MVKNRNFSKAYLHYTAHSMNYKYIVEEPSAILGHYFMWFYCNGRSFDIFLYEGHCINSHKKDIGLEVFFEWIWYPKNALQISKVVIT